MVLKTGRNLSDEEIIRSYAAREVVGIWPSEFYQKLTALAGDLAGRRILEVGCGKGGFLKAIGERFSCELHGVDFVNTYVEEASRRIGPKATITVANVQEQLPYPDHHFDVIFCMEVLEHLKFPERCLAEVGRVLKVEGKLILSIPNATGYFPFHYFGSLIPKGWLKRKLVPYEHPDNTQQPIDTMYTYKEILHLIQSSGLTIEAMSGYRYFRYALGFPLIRTFYTPIYPFLERALEKLGCYRFAYHLILRCGLSAR
jgi:2-polyprenyl-3-methyl-5-hydroxy-6-metoxy-1,4-benzoquinol methylase